MSVKKYLIEHVDLIWSCEVEIDEEKAAPAIKEMVEFWLGWENELNKVNGDYTLAFLKMLGRELLYVVIAERSGETCTEYFKSLEGWYPLDGSHGIKIVSCEDYAFDRFEFNALEVKS